VRACGQLRIAAGHVAEAQVVRGHQQIPGMATVAGAAAPPTPLVITRAA
jgi:hypothetical protein